jgi:hypothetical protein
MAMLVTAEASSGAPDLVAENARLSKEVADMKKRVVAVVKKKTAEHAAATKVGLGEMSRGDTVVMCWGIHRAGDKGDSVEMC